MANTSRINGFKVVKHLNGSPYNGQANLYYVASAADEILAGDVVKLSGSGDANGIPGADLAAATDVPVGIVVGILHSKFKPDGSLTNGSTALDLPAVAQIAASGSGYILVADSPDIVCEVEVNTGGTAFAVTDIGMNVKHANAARTAATVTSPATIDSAVTPATTSTFNFRLLGFSQKVGNEVGASAKVLVGFNVHQYNSVGTTGIS